MSLFDLLFILLVLASLGTFLSAAILALCQHRARALRILQRYAVGLALYFGTVILVSMLTPRRVLALGNPVCFDDWCITPQRAVRIPVTRDLSPNLVSYQLTFQLSSRARGISQREKNLALYLTDVHGARYNPIPQPAEVPLSILLQPGGSIVATRTFQIPAAAQDPGLVITHQGGFPIAWFIIGYEAWFRKPTIIRLPH